MKQLGTCMTSMVFKLPITNNSEQDHMKQGIFFV